MGLTLGAPPEYVNLFMEKYEMRYPVFIVEDDVLEKYYAAMPRVLVPYNVFIGRDGKQAWSELGYDEEKGKAMEDEIVRLLRG